MSRMTRCLMEEFDRAEREQYMAQVRANVAYHGVWSPVAIVREETEMREVVRKSLLQGLIDVLKEA